MKILVVIPRYLPDRVAGAELQAKWLSEAFVEEGNEVVILTKASDSKPEITEENGIKVIRTIENPRTANPQPYRKLLKTWWKEKPDVVHLHHVYPTGLWSLPISLFSSTPVFVTTHAEIRGKNADYDNIRSNPVKDKLCRMATKPCNKLILCASNLEIDAKDMGLKENKYETVNNCIPQDTEKLPEERFREILRDKNIPEEKKIVFLVSRLAEKKGINILIDAANKLDREDTVFVIGGKGPEREKLERKIERERVENVRLLGFLTDEEKKCFLQHCDLFAFPSYSEGFPLVVLEAMRAGSAIISSNIEGPKDILNRENSRFFEPGDSDELSEKISELLEDRELRRKLSENAKEDVKRLKPAKIGKKYLDIFRRER